MLTFLNVVIIQNVSEHWLSQIFLAQLYFLYFLFTSLAPDKDNQDAYSIHPTFGNAADQQAFFGIFDGHGKDGHYCARFARDYVSCNFATLLFSSVSKPLPYFII